MKQIILLFALLIGMMSFVYWSTKGDNLGKIFSGIIPTQTSSTPETVVKVLTPQGDKTVSQEIKVEVVNTAETRATGLSKYSSLEADRGMLFIFDKQDVKPEFWMKDMTFAIDIVWINDGKIAEITSNVLPPSSQDSNAKLVRYLPKTVVDYVLELKTGEAERRGFKVGDEVILPTL